MGGHRGIFRGFSARAAAALGAAGVLSLIAGLGAAAPAGANVHVPTCPIPTQPSITQATPGAGFLKMLAVLRRPKAATDELPSIPGLNPYPLIGDGVEANYIRRAQVVGGTSYYLIPIEHPLRLVANCNAPEELFLTDYTPKGSVSSGGATASGIEHGRSFNTFWTATGATISGIVPDGVAEVTAIYKVGRRRHVSVTMNPIDNVFVTTVPRQLFPQALPEMPTKVIWRAANGKKIRTIDVAR